MGHGDYRSDVTLDIGSGVVALTRQLVDVPSVSFNESALAEQVHDALLALQHLDVTRIGNCVVARTALGKPTRVLMAGHLDTVPAAGNDRAQLDEATAVLRGLGSCDMKGGIAVMLRVLQCVANPSRDITAVFYDCEEVASEHNGLGVLAQRDAELLRADMAILLEPSNAGVEAGCQGTLRAVVRTTGVRAHTARAWRGKNAIHAAADILARLNDYTPREPLIHGLQFREGLQAVAISGGVAGNVVPDDCAVTVNFRFAPDRTAAQAQEHVREVFQGFDIEFVDVAAGAMPGLDTPVIAEFIAAVGADVQPKLGWTDVARFSELGIPAINFGPGNPEFAHSPDEQVPLADLLACESVLVDWLSQH